MDAMAKFVSNHNVEKIGGSTPMEAVTVSSNGTLAGYFVSPLEYDQLRRDIRRNFKIAELTDEEFAQLEAAARMDSRHNHLNNLLEPDAK